VAIRLDSNDADVRSAINTMMTAAGITKPQITFSAGGSGVSPGSTVTVTISAPYKGKGNLELIGLPFLPVPTTLTASASMAKEG
jgi:hypothetical protein